MGETIEKDIEEIKRVLHDISTLQQADHIMTVQHDIILVRGNGVPSLQETVRKLSENVAELVTEFNADRRARFETAQVAVKTCWTEQQSLKDLTTLVNDWVKNVQEERDRRNKKEEDDLKLKKDEELAEKKRKRDELTKWKWTGISIALAVVPPAVWQIILFWVKIVDPALLK